MNCEIFLLKAARSGSEARMAKEIPRKSESEPLLAAWIKWTMHYWETMAPMGPGLAGKSGSDGGSPPEEAVQSDAWLSSLKLWQAFFSLLAEPETVAAVFQGIRAPSEIVLRLAQAGWGSICSYAPTMAGEM
jgi:hypothetical protein